MALKPTCGNRGESTNQGLQYVLGDATIRVSLPAGQLSARALGC
jgi:hypothetical protein